MEKEKLMKTYNYLKKYIEQKINHSDYIDYYKMYNIDQNMSINEINQELEKQEIKNLFQKNNVDSIDNFLKQAFLENSDEVNKMINTFSNENLKKFYDNFINSKVKDRTISDSQKLDMIVQSSISRYGFYHGFASLQALIKYQNYDVITKQNNSRNLAKQLSAEKMNSVIYEKRKDIMDNNQDNIIMDYFSDFINKDNFKEKANVFYDACYNTAIKYDLNNASEQLNYAVKGLIDNSSVERFTNYQNSRDSLKNSKLNSDDCYVLMLAKIHGKRTENNKYSYSNIVSKSKEEKIALFSEIIKEEAKGIENSHKK